MQHHKYSLDEIDGLIPWEKEVYISLLLDHLKEQEMQRKSEESRRR
tara:strand:- start:254 stop:391 length:138 start_codon:yes stop_codon:yes gene_type:complete